MKVLLEREHNEKIWTVSHSEETAWDGLDRQNSDYYSDGDHEREIYKMDKREEERYRDYNEYGGTLTAVRTQRGLRFKVI